MAEVGSYCFDRALAAASHCRHLSGCERPVEDHVADEVVLRGSEGWRHALGGLSVQDQYTSRDTVHYMAEMSHEHRVRFFGLSLLKFQRVPRPAMLT
jgi:hypothetical protein